MKIKNHKHLIELNIFDLFKALGKVAFVSVVSISPIFVFNREDISWELSLLPLTTFILWINLSKIFKLDVYYEVSKVYRSNGIYRKFYKFITR